MRRFNKKVLFGGLGVLLGAIVVVFLFFRDQVKLVSIKILTLSCTPIKSKASRWMKITST